jgi:hypothetical protein
MLGAFADLRKLAVQNHYLRGPIGHFFHRLSVDSSLPWDLTPELRRAWGSEEENQTPDTS